ncbi:unnamed protein product, partial [Ectocarpus sp. 12 AP-2014]
GSSVNKRHLGAFNITKDRFWFASTLELQLASLDLCKACRGFPALRVWVEGETPPDLRFGREPRIKGSSGHVPLKCAASLFAGGRVRG